MLTLENIGIEFGGRWLLRDASYQFLPGERIGLIGRNGAGKSTLLRVITGDIRQTEGQVHRAGNLKIGYFHQDLLSYETERSIFDVASDAFASLLAVKKELDDLLDRMERGESQEEDWDRLVTLQEDWDTHGGPTMDAEIHSVLSGLGFPAARHDEPYHTFSGGWRMRVLLAKMLLTQPDILLLDEPTNHLDLPSIQWLENYLKTFRGSCVIVSHDRYFLDRMADKILEISLKELFVYPGNYSFYVQEKAMRMELHTRAYENQQKFIEDQEKFINRFKAKASKAKQAQSRIKQLDRIERIEAPEEESFDLSFRFKTRVTSGREVLSLSHIEKAYGEKVILRGGEAIIMRGEKVGLIGANGLGKSTLLRIVADSEPFKGERKVGHNVETAFYAQHQLEALNLKNNILDEVSTASREKTEAELRTILGCFMYSGDDIFKKIQVLSGGEKSRVALAKTLLTEANFLLLDEPTNHLDIQSIQILVEAINAYEGACVIVSHDRFFLQQVTNKIWYIEDQMLKEYPGSYDEYVDWKNRQELAAKAAAEPPVRKEVVVNTPKPAEAPPVNYQQQKQSKNKLRKLEKEQEEIEKRISDLEIQRQQLEQKLADPAIAADFRKFSQAQTEFDRLTRDIDSATLRWDEVVSELEVVKKEG
ncbi:MAG: ABC transporter ATP-binding protein [Bacteroidetes bacterium]|nr:MAG: ABC transporter ATP-binding protein [Bacteroidota bacterium]